MKKRLALAILLAMTCLLIISVAGMSNDVDKTISVLFVGKNQMNRMDEFAQFLGKHFEKVDTLDYSDFSFDKADAYDILIVDFRFGKEWKPAPQFPEDFTKATVLISSGDYMFRNWNPGPIFNWL